MKQKFARKSASRKSHWKYPKQAQNSLNLATFSLSWHHWLSGSLTSRPLTQSLAVRSSSPSIALPPRSQRFHDVRHYCTNHVWDKWQVYVTHPPNLSRVPHIDRTFRAVVCSSDVYLGVRQGKELKSNLSISVTSVIKTFWSWHQRIHRLIEKAGNPYQN